MFTFEVHGVSLLCYVCGKLQFTRATEYVLRLVCVCLSSHRIACRRMERKCAQKIDNHSVTAYRGREYAKLPTTQNTLYTDRMPMNIWFTWREAKLMEKKKRAFNGIVSSWCENIHINRGPNAKSGRYKLQKYASRHSAFMGFNLRIDIDA